MDDGRLHDLHNELSDMLDGYGVDTPQRIALLQVRAIAVFAEQVSQTGRQVERAADMLEEFIDRRAAWPLRVRRWLSWGK